MGLGGVGQLGNRWNVLRCEGAFGRLGSKKELPVVEDDRSFGAGTGSQREEVQRVGWVGDDRFGADLEENGK